MRICFLLSSLGGSPLQVGLERGLCQLGHSVEYYRHGESRFDLLVVFNQVAHNANYGYPPFPDYWRGPVAFVDAAEYGYFRRLPGVIKEYANSFTPAAMHHDTKNYHEQLRLRQFLEGRSFPYFLREFSIYVDYPRGYHEIDYPEYLHSICHEPPNREEYLRRDLELFCWWGMSHPWRVPITQALRDSHRKAEIGDRWQDENLNQGHYFNRMRAAKCSPSFDGYGSSSFRLCEVLNRTVLLMGPLTIRMREPLQDRVHCRTYDVVSDGETFISTNIGDVMREVLEDPEGSFSLYEAGYHHCRERLSERATAEYLLRVVEQHDFSKPTPLDV